MIKIILLSCLLTLVLSIIARAADQRPVLNLWPGVAPGEKGDIPEETLTPAKNAADCDRIANVSKPTITLYKPDKEKDTGAAIVICPGGGYSILAIEHEGEAVAKWANNIGVTGILLKYRVPVRKGLPRHLPPLQDAQRAIRLARANAKEWRIDPKRIGILGFSAGGHLSAMASTNYGKNSYEAIDNTDKLDCRPDFTVLIYPAYLVEKDGSLSKDLPIDAKTPPAFLEQASDDGINCENAVAYFLALKKNKIAADLHIYAHGGHGYGMRPAPGRPGVGRSAARNG